MNAQQTRKAYSLLEALMVAVILGIISMVVISRFSGPNEDARRNACYMNKGNIDVQVQVWRREKGSWPATDLSDIGSDPKYFPEGLPTCPIDGSTYTLDPVTHKVVGHSHN